MNRVGYLEQENEQADQTESHHAQHYQQVDDIAIHLLSMFATILLRTDPSLVAWTDKADHIIICTRDHDE